MNVSEYTVQKIVLASWVWVNQEEAPIAVTTISPPIPTKKSFDILQPLRQWLDCIEVRNPQLAHRICQLVPSQCPFERDVKLFGKVLFHIPPMCKLNPLYEEVVGLRFRALCFLADECGEDVTSYC